MPTLIKWEDADFKWNNNTFTWDEIQLVEEIQEIIQGGGDFDEEIYKYDASKRRKLISLTLKVYGDTITEKKQKEIKQYKIKAEDIRLVVKKVLGVEMIAEDISF